MGPEERLAGPVTNYPSTVSVPSDITSGPDGALWFTNTTGNSIGRITVLGAIQVFTGVGIDKPVGITKGPDGALWFAEF